MVTPFDDQGKVDLDSALTLADQLIRDGADSLLLFGTTGEAPTIHQPEKDLVVSEVVAAFGKRATIVAGAGSNDTAHATRMARGAERSGAQGILAVSPYYNRPSQEGVYQHLKAVADATDLPTVLYDIPGRTGVAIGDECLARLAEHPRIVGVKDATGDVPSGFARMEWSGLEFYSGDDALNFDWLAHGAVGVISVVGHVAAGDYREMIREVDAGDLPGARAIAARLRPLVAAMMGGGQGAVMSKHAVHMRQLITTPHVRLPLVNAEQSEIDQLSEVMHRLGYLS